MLARLGQHQELLTKPLVNCTPDSTISRYRFGMMSGVTVPATWSSVTTSRTLGRAVDEAIGSVPDEARLLSAGVASIPSSKAARSASRGPRRASPGMAHIANTSAPRGVETLMVDLAVFG